MDLKALRYFVKTVEMGSFSAAAKACFVAQPSITHAIANLESEFNCQLLVRHRKGCSTTPEGMQLFVRAQQLLAHAKSIQYDLSPKYKLDNLTLSVDSNIHIEVLENVIKSIRSYRPITVTLVSKERESSADLYLTTAKENNAKSNFVALTEENYALLIPSTHPLAYSDNIQLEDLQSQPLIKRIHCENQLFFEQITRELNIEFNVVAEVQNEEWALSLVRSGLGLCFAPVPLSFKDTGIVVKELKDNLTHTLPKRIVGIEIRKQSDEISEIFSGNDLFN